MTQAARRDIERQHYMAYIASRDAKLQPFRDPIPPKTDTQKYLDRYVTIFGMKIRVPSWLFGKKGRGPKRSQISGDNSIQIQVGRDLDVTLYKTRPVTNTGPRLCLS